MSDLALSFTEARRRAREALERDGQHYIVYHVTGGFDYCSEHDYKTFRIDIWPDDVAFHTLEGTYID